MSPPTPGLSPLSPFTPGRTAFLALGLFLAIAQLGGCSCDQGPGAPPVVNLDTEFSVNELPEAVSDPKLPVSGRSSLNTTVWIELNGAPATNFALTNGFMLWAGTATLVEGPNTLRFHPRNAAGASGTGSQVFTVVLDTTPPEAPVLDAEPPACIGTPSYTLSGSVEPGATLSLNGMLVDTQDDGSFTIEVPLTSDATTLNLSATDAAGNTSQATTLTLTRGLAAPTLDPLPPVVGDATQTLTGSKPADTGVYLIWTAGNAGELELVAPNADTTWTATVTFPEGPSAFQLEARTAAGGASCEPSAEVDLTVSNVCPVDVDDSGFMSPTSNPTLTVPGTKCAGTAVHVVFEGEDLEDSQQVVPLDAATTFSFDLTLQEGPNTFHVLLRDGTGLPGPTDGPFTVVLDTTPPNPPLYVPEPPAQSLDFDLRLTGTKDPNTNVCLRVDTQPACTVVVPLSAGTDWAFTHTLHPDTNFLCISSFDAVGLQSTETCASIDQGAGTGVQIIAPPNGSVINDTPFTVTVLAQDENDQGAARVEICLDALCANATNTAGLMWELERVAQGFTNGTVHTLRATGYASNGSLIGSAQISLLYIVDGLLLSSSAPEQPSAQARLALDGDGVLHVFWHDNCGQDDNCAERVDGTLPYDIFHRALVDGAWTPIEVVSAEAGDADSRNPSVATDLMGNLHVVWEDNGNINNSGNDFDLVHRMLDIETGRWSATRVVTDNVRDDRNPDLAAGPDGLLHLAYQTSTSTDGPEDIDIFLTSLNTDSGSWSSPLLLSDQAGNVRSTLPAVATDGQGAVYVVWQDTGDVLNSGADSDIVLRVVEAGVMDAAVLVSNNALDGESRLADLVVDGTGVAQVVWQDTATVLNSGADLDIFHRSYTRGADPALSDYNLVSRGANDGSSQEAVVTLDPDSNNIYIAWADSGDLDSSGSTDVDLFYVRGIDGAFTNPTRLSANPFNMTSEWPDLLYDTHTQTLHCVWEDDSTVQNDGNDRDIFYLGITLR